VWHTGPLAKGQQSLSRNGGKRICAPEAPRSHAGRNLARARAPFAMSAIARWRETQAQHGSGRYSLWTGDAGLAAYLWDCISGEPHFPTLDVF